MVDDCIFVNNTAAKNGGAVYLDNIKQGECDNTTFSNSHFENNSAAINGGAIDWHEGATNGVVVLFTGLVLMVLLKVLISLIIVL